MSRGLSSRRRRSREDVRHVAAALAVPADVDVAAGRLLRAEAAEALRQRRHPPAREAAAEREG